jgi:hypothetical protein
MEPLPEVKDTRTDYKALFAIGIPTLAGWVFTFLEFKFFQGFAEGLFLWLPFVLGLTSTLIYGYKSPTGRVNFWAIPFMSLLLYSIGLLIFAMEGAICLIMAFPIGLMFTLLGYLIGRLFISKKSGNSSTTVILLLLSVPMFMAFEGISPDKEKVRSVTTSIEIAATPEQVWKNIITFPQLKEPGELIFKSGIAYPINATIDGRGVGAIRHCNFSTGTFVEPITVWDENSLLKFSVVTQPEPMKEISPYNIHPEHLKGYWLSKEGQFKLTRLPNGHTLLEGTTWYINKIRPGFYWAIWSDYIVHKIHKRVLTHIKEQTESYNKQAH